MTITLTTDAMGRTVVLVPDETARLLTAHQDEGWREVPDVGWGCSRRFPADHPVTLAAAPIEAALQAHGVVHALVAGVGDWNPFTRCWRNYLQHRDLHPRFFDIDPADGTLRFSG